ncbi:MAG: RICIN domain-containing protein [Pseudomonadota bacterium]|nr:RICIN domain-containing protein [Pseudomonadota bacterium]
MKTLSSIAPDARACRSTLALALLAALALPTIAGATEVAPYFETWAYGSSLKPATLMAAKSAGNVLGATMAFGVSAGGCTLGGGLDAIMSGSGKTDVANFQAAGGRVILSFGGADGTYLEGACSDDGMYNLIKSVIDTTQVFSIDFDVEGSQLDNTALNTRRNNVVKRLQTTYPSLYVSYTLPVSPSGLESNGLAVVKSANSAGVKVSMINVMAMDYGSASSAMGDLAISAANGTFNQIKGVFTGKTDAQLWAMIGVTPMIGVNDTQSEVFTVADASKLTTFAQQNGLGLLSFWAMQRDMPGGSDYNNYSLVNTTAYQFYTTMAAAKVAQPDALADGTYTITSAYSGKCVDIASASTADSAQVQQYQCNGTGAQKFTLKNMGSGWYRLLNTNSGKAIDIAAASTADGAKVQQYTDNGTLAQRFSIKAAADPTTFVITNENSGKCLDVADWSTNDGGKIQQWSCSGNVNQTYRFTKQ